MNVQFTHILSDSTEKRFSKVNFISTPEYGKVSGGSRHIRTIHVCTYERQSPALRIL